jgi:predicted enzyme related to lactoylglutathione lyase
MKMPDPQAPTLWCPYASVADCDAAVDKARGLGAQLMMPGTDIPNIGRFAVLVDPQGACIAMIQPAPMGA